MILLLSITGIVRLTREESPSVDLVVPLLLLAVLPFFHPTYYLLGMLGIACFLLLAVWQRWIPRVALALLFTWIPFVTIQLLWPEAMLRRAFPFALLADPAAVLREMGLPVCYHGLTIVLTVGD